MLIRIMLIKALGHILTHSDYLASDELWLCSVSMSEMLFAPDLSNLIASFI